MKIIEMTVPVNSDRTITVQLPPDVAPAAKEVTVRVMIEEPSKREPMQFSAHDVGPWPEGFTVRREEIYGDDGR